MQSYFLGILQYDPVSLIVSQVKYVSQEQTIVCSFSKVLHNLNSHSRYSGAPLSSGLIICITKRGLKNKPLGKKMVRKHLALIKMFQLM